MQDFLTWLIDATLLFSVVYFTCLFVLSVPVYEQHIRDRGITTVTLAAPVPTAPPAISVEQADQNLDSQIDALILANEFPTLCRSLLLTPPQKAQPKKMTQAVIATTTKAKKHSVTHLRSLCSTHNINWKNVHAKNKHLTQDQMIEALAQKGVPL